MKLTLVAGAIALATLSLPALAGEDSKQLLITPTLRSDSNSGPYVAAYGGVNWSTDFGNEKTTSSTAGVTTDITPDTIHSDIGGVGGVKVGYNFASYPFNESLSLQPAVEGEALYIGSRSSAHLNGGGDDLTLSYNSAAWFANGLIRFVIVNTRITPYLGIGIGGEYISTHGDDSSVTGGKITGFDASTVDFAFQGLAGFDFAIVPHWSLFTEYKFIDAIDTKLKYTNVGASGTDVTFKPDQFAQQIATVGLKYNF